MHKAVSMPAHVHVTCLQAAGEEQARAAGGDSIHACPLKQLQELLFLDQPLGCAVLSLMLGGLAQEGGVGDAAAAAAGHCVSKGAEAAGAAQSRGGQQQGARVFTQQHVEAAVRLHFPGTVTTGTTEQGPGTKPVHTGRGRGRVANKADRQAAGEAAAGGAEGEAEGGQWSLERRMKLCTQLRVFLIHKLRQHEEGQGLSISPELDHDPDLLKSRYASL